MNNANKNRGFTLVEILMATALTLVVMGTLVEVFDRIGTSVAESRSALEMADRLRNTRDLLQNDLGNLTCPTVPWVRPETGVGYFEYIEGPYREFYNNVTRENTSSVATFPTDQSSVVHEDTLGDFDDMLLMTVKSRGEPFIGIVGGSTVQSNTAEVIWYCRENPADGSLGTPGLRTIFRKVRLVAPSASNSSATVTTYSLGELTDRKNRNFHAVDYPHAVNVMDLFDNTDAATDTMLANVLSFDVRVYDPGAPYYFRPPNTGPVFVGEKGWDGGLVQMVGLSGGYVDLGFLGEDYTNPTSIFSSRGHPKSGLDGDTTASRTYCTWSYGFESDGLNQDNAYDVDQGTDGFDTDMKNGVDDIGERETRPPYDAALRGLRVTIRVLEPSSGQIRQVSVVQHFAPK